MRVSDRYLSLVVLGISFAAFSATAQAAPQEPSNPPPVNGPAHPQTREGFWFNIGFGYGSLGCQDCVGREGGLSGGLSLGGTVTDRLLLGVGTSGWVKDINGTRLTVGTFDARLRFYPVRTSGFFITGGLGVGSVSVAGDSESGLGLLIGVGWDLRVGRNISLTPFYNGFAMANSNVDANVGQIGIGVTFH
jgi:hypothetical protein